MVKAPSQVKFSAFKKGFKPAEVYTCVPEAAHQVIGELLRAIAIQKNIYVNPARGCLYQRIRNPVARFVLIKNIGLQVNRMLSFINHLLQQIEILVATPHKLNFVVV
jgi:hypothetical protein